MRKSSVISLSLAILFGIGAIYYSFFNCYVMYMPMNSASNTSVQICGLSNYADFAKDVKVLTNRPSNNSYAGELVSYSGKMGTILNEIPKSKASRKSFMDDYNSNALIRNLFAFLSIGLGVVFVVISRKKKNPNNMN